MADCMGRKYRRRHGSEEASADIRRIGTYEGEMRKLHCIDPDHRRSGAAAAGSHRDPGESSLPGVNRRSAHAAIELTRALRATVVKGRFREFAEAEVLVKRVSWRVRGDGQSRPAPCVG